MSSLLGGGDGFCVLPSRLGCGEECETKRKGGRT